jgi:hypothetical protein
MTATDETPTPEQIAACERAMDGLEAQADIWADEVDLVLIVKNLGKVARGLNDRMPKDVREGFINRLEAQIDAITRQAYLEGFMRGGDSRKDYEDAKRAALTAALSDQVVVPNSAAQFVMWALLNGSWQGNDIDGGAAQDKAIELGLIVETTYDPAIHGDGGHCEPGDAWYAPSEKLIAMLAAPPPSSTAGGDPDA